MDLFKVTQHVLAELDLNPYLLSFSPVFSRLFFKKASGPSFSLPFVVVVV